MPINLTDAERIEFSKQTALEIDSGYSYLKPDWDKYDFYWDEYKNQKEAIQKKEIKIKEFSCFSIMQNLMALLTEDLYDFILKATSREDVESVNILEKLLRYDFEKTDRESLDVDLTWNTLFYGKGNVLLHQYNKLRSRTKTDTDYFAPIGTVINERTFLHNPTATHGQKSPDGTGGYTYAGWIGVTTKTELRKYPRYYTYTEDMLRQATYNKSTVSKTAITDIISGFIEKYTNKDKIQSAITRNPNKEYGDNEEIYLFNWMTYWQGSPVYAIFLHNTDNIIHFETLPYQDLPFITRTLFPSTNTDNTISIPSLTIPSQRGKQVVINMAVENQIKQQQGMYVFDDTRITQRDKLQNPIGAYIPINGPVDGALQRVEAGTANSATDFILNTIIASEQRATGSTSQQVGGLDYKVRSAQEVATINQTSANKALSVRKRFKKDIEAYILQAIRIYDNLPRGSLYNKTIRIEGLGNTEFITLTRRDIRRVSDVDVVVEDRAEQRQERINNLPFVDRVIQHSLTYQGTDQRQLLKISSEKLGLTQEEIDLIYPPTASEILAELENVPLGNNEEGIDASEEDDHNEHLAIHKNAEYSPALRRHIQQHIFFKVQQERDAELRQERAALQQQELAQAQTGGNPRQQSQNLNNISLQQPVGTVDDTQSVLGGPVQNSGAANL